MPTVSVVITQRTCYSCKHQNYCYVKKSFDDVLLRETILYSGYANEQQKQPKQRVDIFETVALCCTIYEGFPEK